jgi:hypothetical protein
MVYLNAADNDYHLAALLKRYQRSILANKVGECMSNAEGTISIDRGK